MVKISSDWKTTSSYTLVFLPVVLPLDWLDYGIMSVCIRSLQLQANLTSFCRFPGRKLACTRMSNGPVDIKINQ
jgi:hypothetical protein